MSIPIWPGKDEAPFEEPVNVHVTEAIANKPVAKRRVGLGAVDKIMVCRWIVCRFKIGALNKA